ncbi:MAG: FAD-dependent oxidoreductase [Alphaproteobacteria bacterium]
MIIVIGAGIIGLFTAYNLLKKGKKVKIFDTPSLKGSSSDAAVGMLAPLIEAKPLESELFNLMIESKKSWKEFVHLEPINSYIKFKDNGALMVALNQDDNEKLKFKKNYFDNLGYKTELLSANQTLKIEPSLNSNVYSSLFCKNQDQVNPVLLKKFLIEEIISMNGEYLIGKKIDKLKLDDGNVFFGNKSYKFDNIIIACGAWSSEIISNSFGIKIPLRPVKGVSLILNSKCNTISHNLWFRNIYIAPRDNGKLAIGATEDEKGFDHEIKIDELYFLINSIWESFPRLEDLSLNKIKVGLRPTTIDGSPIIGPLNDFNNKILCNFGHYRHGILLAPKSADIISNYVFNKEVLSKDKFFSPSRFNL